MREPIVFSGFLKDAHFWTFEEFVLDSLLRNYIRRGTLIVHFPDGKTRAYGSGTPMVAIRFQDHMALWALGLDPDLKLGELYMDGRLTIEQGDIVALMDLLVGNVAMSGISGSHRALRFLRQLFRAFGQFNPGRPGTRPCGASLRSVEPALRPVPGQHGNIPAPISRRPGHAGSGAGDKKSHIAAKLISTGPV